MVCRRQEGISRCPRRRFILLQGRNKDAAYAARSGHAVEYEMSYGLNSVAHNYGSVPGRTCGYLLLLLLLLLLFVCVFTMCFKLTLQHNCSTERHIVK